MSPLTARQSIAMIMFDLANGYRHQFGDAPFVLKAINTALKYYPTCVPLLPSRANYIDNRIKKERKKDNPDSENIADNIKLYKGTLARIDALGYKDMPPELYKEWVKSVELEKAKLKVKR